MDQKEDITTRLTTQAKDNHIIQTILKVGCKPIYTSPEQMKKDIIQYFQHVENNRNWDIQNWVGKDGNEVTKKVKCPYTKQGLCNYLGITMDTYDNYKNKQKNQIADNKEISEHESKINAEFFGLLTLVEQIIIQHQLEGAMVGQFNSNIVSRINGWSDNRHVTGEVNVINRLGGIKVELPEGVELRKVIDTDHKEINE